MEKRVFIAFLLVCCVAGFPAEEATDDLFHGTEYLSFNKLTDKLTDKLPDSLTDPFFQQVPHVYDDDENLVPIELGIKHTEELTDDSMVERVKFILYTRKSSTHPELIYVDDDAALDKSYFDPKKPTRFVTHGWMNSARSKACTLVRDAYLKHDDCNVIVVDWSSISFRPYLWASNRVKKVGNYLSKLLDFLVKKGTDPSKILLAGHSLGAHVVGIAARNAENKIAYVVGLDPAWPNFYIAEPGARISKGDATYVEIIHTNAGLLGFYPAIGDSDFYPNGGSRQSGCYADVGGACSHARSFKYFAESINSEKKFSSTECTTYTQYILGMCKKQQRAKMGGLKPNLDTKGTFQLKTNSKSPYVTGK